jgi:hypothetical protein
MEALVTNSTRSPAARSRATASLVPGISWWASHTTPSRSSSQAIGRRYRHGLPVPAGPARTGGTGARGC